jgi:hypothetical protein
MALTIGPPAPRRLTVSLLLLLAVGGGAAAPSTQARASAPVSVFQDDALLLRSGAAARDHALDELAATGVDVVRVLVIWRALVPRPSSVVAPHGADADPPADALAPLQALDTAAAARGLRLLLTVTGPGPAWASRCGGPAALRRTCRPDPGRFARFVAAVGAALPGRRLWSIWNEPNAGTWLTPQRSRGRLVSPGLYRALVMAGTRALAASGHRGDTILVGETAPTGRAGGPEATRPTPPGRFLRALFCGLRRGRCAPLPGTGLAHHVYPTTTLPVPCAPSAPDQLGPTALDSLQRLLRTAGARGLTHGRLPLWITESGVQTNPPDRLFGVSLDQQAADVNALEWLATRSGAVSVAQYLLLDEPRLSGFQSGLRFADGRPKPALAAYALPLWVTRTRGGVRVWGRVRAVADRGPLAVTIEHRPPGSSRWHAERTVTVTSSGHIVALSLRARPTGSWRLSAAGVRSRVAHAAGPC